MLVSMVRSGNVAEQFKSSLFDECGDWWLPSPCVTDMAVYYVQRMCRGHH